MPTTSFSSPSSAPLLNPLVFVRGFPLIAVVLVGMAMLFGRHENIHSVCLGGAFGVLIGYTVFCFAIKGIALKPGRETADAQQSSIA